MATPRKDQAPAIASIRTITIDELDTQWRGVSHGRGAFIFLVPQGLPGDVVRVRVEAVSLSSRTIHASMLEVISPSPLRVEAFCGVFPQCYGCPGATLDYGAQVELKRERLQALFPGAERFTASTPLGYRSKTKWVAAAHPSGGLLLGGYRHRSHEVVHLGTCPVTHPQIMALYEPLQESLARIPPYDEATRRGLLRSVFVKRTSSGEMLITFVVTAHPDPSTISHLLSIAAHEAVKGITLNIHDGDGNVLTGTTEYPIYGVSHLLETHHPRPYPVNATAFSQINSEIAQKIYARIGELVGMGHDLIVDLYAGNGPIALALSRNATEVIAVERSKAAVTLGRSLDTEVTFLHEDAADGGALSRMLRSRQPQVIVINPPRSGVREVGLKRIATLGPGTICYMSCNPLTLKRDAELLDRLGYTLTHVEGYDMFPHTAHFETLALFAPKGEHCK